MILTLCLPCFPDGRQTRFLWLRATFKVDTFRFVLTITEARCGTPRPARCLVSRHPPLYASIPYKVRVSIEREARRYAGYQWGAKLSDEFLQTMEKSQNNVMADVNHLIVKQDDPRRAEVFRALQARGNHASLGDPD